MRILSRISVRPLIVLTLAATFCLMFGLNGMRVPPQSKIDTGEAQARAVSNARQLPVSFIENGGQVDERVAFYVKGNDKTVYFTDEGLTILLSSDEGTSSGNQDS